MTCSIPNCGRPVIARGWCNRHWCRWRRHGDPLGGAMGRGHVREYYETTVLTYESDGCLIWPFAIGTHGYGVLGNGFTVPRLVCEKIYGPPPFARAEAAHTCDVRACVNHRHLYWGTRQQNEDDKLRRWAKRGRKSIKLDSLQ